MDVVVLTAIVALAILAVVTFFSLRRGGASETTFRNLTRGEITYSVRAWDADAPPRSRTLRPEQIDRVHTAKPLEVTYPSLGRTILFIASPGKPYSFRYNEEGRPQLYPGSHGMKDAVDLAPYVQTPMPVVEKMLEMARLAPGDLLYDLGCGDGRIVITAAREYKVRGVGIDIDPDLIAVSRKRAKKEGVAGLTRFVRMDATRADLRPATVVTLYLLPESNQILRPLLEKELRPGARVVSHNYGIPGWNDRLAGRAALTDEKGVAHTIYLYRVPGPAAASGRGETLAR